jgi:hypothetical protein
VSMTSESRPWRSGAVAAAGDEAELVVEGFGAASADTAVNGSEDPVAVATDRLREPDQQRKAVRVALLMNRSIRIVTS